MVQIVHSIDKYMHSVWLIIYGFVIGEYFVSLKGYKIPLKTPEKNSQFDTNNPPPPGTEDDAQQKDGRDSYVSPLAAVKRPAQPKFQNAPTPIQMPVQTTPIQTSDNSPTKSTKRSALFSKWINELA